MDNDTKARQRIATMRALETLQQAQARYTADPRNRENPPGYAKQCRAYAMRDAWTLGEAASLFCSCRRQRPAHIEGHSALNTRVAEMRKFLASCVGVSLQPVAPIPRLQKWKTRYPIHAFYALSQAKKIALPEALNDALARQFVEVPASNDKKHGNTVRNERIRCAACECALQLCDARPDTFRYTGRANIKALANYLEAHPEQWKPDYKEGDSSPLKHRALSDHLRTYFRGAGK